MQTIPNLINEIADALKTTPDPETRGNWLVFCEGKILIKNRQRLAVNDIVLMKITPDQMRFGLTLREYENAAKKTLSLIKAQKRL